MLRASRAIYLRWLRRPTTVPSKQAARPPYENTILRRPRVCERYLLSVLLRQAVGYGIDYGWMMT